MQKIKLGNLSVLQFDIFRKEHEIKHCITTKEGWETGRKTRFSASEEHPWKEYREELSRAMNVATERIYFPKQTHSDRVEMVTEKTTREDLEGTDALVTNRKDFALPFKRLIVYPFCCSTRNKK